MTPQIAPPVQRWIARLARRHHLSVAQRRREEFEQRERDVAQRQILLRHLLEIMMTRQVSDDGLPT